MQRIIAVCRPYVVDVVEGSPWFDGHLFLNSRGPWAQRWPTVAWRMRKAGIDLAVLFPNSFRSGLVAWLGRCAAPRRLRSLPARQSAGPRALTPTRTPDGKTQAVADHRRLQPPRPGPRVVPGPGISMELYTVPANEAAADRVWDKFGFLPGDEIVCLNPGRCAFGAAKFWPATSFAKLAQDLVDRRGSPGCWCCAGRTNASRRGRSLSSPIGPASSRLPMRRCRWG